MSDDGFELAVDTLDVFGDPGTADKDEEPEQSVEKEEKVEKDVKQEEPKVVVEKAESLLKVAPAVKKDEKLDEPKPVEIKANTSKTSGAGSDLNGSIRKKMKDPESCKKFRLDPAGEFGACIHCGRQRKEHGEKKQNKAAQILNQHRIRNSTAQDDVEMRVGEGPCDDFKLDLAADGFAVCKVCGYKRTEHGQKGMNKAEKALKDLKEKNKKKYNGRSSKDGPCTNYKVDTEAAEFGACLYCGFKKESHVKKEENAASRMVRELREKNEAKHKMEDLEAEGQQPEVTDTDEKDKAEVKELDKEEVKAAEPVPKKKKRGTCCVIS